MDSGFAFAEKNARYTEDNYRYTGAKGANVELRVGLPQGSVTGIKVVPSTTSRL